MRETFTMVFSVVGLCLAFYLATHYLENTEEGKGGFVAVIIIVASFVAGVFMEYSILH